MAKIVPSALVVLSILCGCLMYYNSIRLTNFSKKVNSLTNLNAEGVLRLNDTEIGKQALIGELERTVREIAEKNLFDVKREVDDLRERERRLNSIFAESCPSASNVMPVSQLSLNRVNYADEILGARIERFSGHLAEDKRYLSWLIRNSNPPENMLRSGMKPGCCFAFKRSKANVTIALAEAIFVEAIEVQHIPKYLSPSKETISAPREFRVYGLSAESKLINFGNFEYENRDTFQIFNISSDSPCERVRVDFLTNHGSVNFTCVYRISVYGHP